MMAIASDSILPAADALPLPAPAFLLEILLQLTFFLHLLAMNAMLGGLLITLGARFRSRETGDQWSVLADAIAGATPMLVAATVTLGVAPLLFLQTLYGQFFFTSSILMGWGWFSVVVVLIFAYYGTYLQSFRKKNLGSARTPLLFMTVLLFLWVAFMFANNTSLMAAVPLWGAKYFSDPRGLHMNLGDPTLLPRYLHAILAAVAVAGLMLTWWGRQRLAGSDQSGTFMARTGLSIFTWVTAVNVLFGLWYLLSVPKVARSAFMGQDLTATILLTVGLLLAIVLPVYSWRARHDPAGRSLGGLITLTAVLMAVMVMIRHTVRMTILGPLYQPDSFAVKTQVLNLALFFGLLLGGVVTVFWMVKKLRSSWN